MPMEQQPICFLKLLPLKEMALRRLVINFWNESDILEALEKLLFKSYNGFINDDVWREIVDKVKNKVSKLVFPASLKKQMMYLVKTIGSDLLRWKMFHKCILEDSREYVNMRILEHLCWTCTGAVNYQKTAEQLVRLKALGVVKRYKFASLYCLVDSISTLWEKLPKKYKTSLYKQRRIQVGVTFLECYWARILKEKQSKRNYLYVRPLILEKLEEHVFEYSALTGSKAATEYFFQKLTNEERDSTLYSTIIEVISNSINFVMLPYVSQKEKLSDVFWYLLSLMNPEQQMKILKEQMCHILTCLLDWPWQDLFLDRAHIIWTILNERHYKYLLHNIIENIKYMGYHFRNLFQEIFMSSSSEFKQHFLHRESQSCEFFSEFFDVEDSETIEVVFRNIDSGDRVRLVFCHSFFKVLDDTLMRDKWHLVEMCLREAALTKEDRKRLKRAYRRFLRRSDGDLGEPRKFRWKRVFDFLDETNASRLA